MRVVVLALAVAVASTSTAAPALRSPSGEREHLQLATGRFDPLTAPNSEATPGRYAIVQFKPESPLDAASLQARGMRIVGFVPNHAYLVEATAEAQSALRRDPDIRFVGPWLTSYKVAPQIEAGSEPLVELTVVLFRGEAAAEWLSSLRAITGDSGATASDAGAWPQIRTTVTREQLNDAVAAIATLEGVQWIERTPQLKLSNAQAVWPIQANQAAGANPIGNAPIWAQDIIGTGQIVALADSGLDRNEGWFTQWHNGTTLNTEITDASNTTPPTPGPVFPNRKVYGYFVQPTATGYDNNATCPGGSPTSFHGTHTSGTVVGDSGTAATPTDPGYTTGDGMAPNAQILFQDIGNDSSGCLTGATGLALFQQARNAGAHISSNSYGSAYANAPFYTVGDAEVDQAAWVNQDLLIAFAAGNEGSAATTIGHPAHAKNALTVGALGSGNSVTAAGFSSRGPTSDGRRKPDIMAPGTLSSAAGDTNNTTTDAPTTQTLSGTSMATPAVAGGAALLRQYFTDGFYPTGIRTAANARVPLGDEMKAVLTNGTAFLSNTPGNTSGWGRIWLDNNLYFPGDARDLRTFAREHATGLATGEQHEYQVRVEAGQEFRATLAWYDVPGTPGAAGTALVNNLDLEVVEGANTYRGNVITGAGATANSTTGGSADVLNTVEQVRLTAPVAGTYTIRVRGSNIPGDGQQGSNRQGYGLAISGGQCASQVTGAPGSIAASNVAGGVQVVAGSVSGATRYQLYRAPGTCASALTERFQLAEHGNTTLLDARSQGGYSYAYKVRGVDACGEGPLSACTDIVSTAACTLRPTFNASSVTANRIAPNDCGVLIQWAAATSNCPTATSVRYNIHRSTDPLFLPAAGNRIATGIAGSSFTDTTAQSLTTYHYIVRAEDTTSGNPGPGGGNETTNSQRVKYTPSGVSVPGTFSDGADSPSFMEEVAPWSISNDRFDTGSFSYRSARDGTATYLPDTCAAITTPVLDLPAGTSTLTFRARYNLEANWDGVVLEASTDGGPFLVVTPSGGYPSNFSQTGSPPINACGYLSSQGAFSGSTAGAFQTFTANLTGASARSVRLRWRFSSDPGSEEEGFYLDGIQVTNASTPGMCSSDMLLINGFE